MSTALVLLMIPGVGYARDQSSNAARRETNVQIGSSTPDLLEENRLSRSFGSR